MFGLLGWNALEVAMVVVAVYAAFATVTLGALPGLTIAGGIRTALGRGVIALQSGDEGEVVSVTPPLGIEPEVLESALDVLVEALRT